MPPIPPAARPPASDIMTENAAPAHTASWANSPVGTALIALVATLVGAAIAAFVAWRGTDVDRAAADREREFELARYKGEIIRAVKDFDRDTADVLLEHTVKEIDRADRYERFYNDYQNLLAKLRAGPDPRAPTLDTSIRGIVAPPKAQAQSPTELVRLFPGSERGIASRQLVTLYSTQPKEVVDALIGALLPASDPRSYRVNLYVAYTLAKIQPSWSGTAEQLKAIQSLTQQANYLDPTFRQRVDEAIERFRLRR